MGQFSVEIMPPNGSVLSGNQQYYQAPFAKPRAYRLRQKSSICLARLSASRKSNAAVVCLSLRSTIGN